MLLGSSVSVAALVKLPRPISDYALYSRSFSEYNQEYCHSDV